ncbi:MAG: twin-arginine translocation signal domain-containing protein, partial [Patescibacteria group bacterium]|nr:twin-arginine translocation signal domain-containing protein [Patescibacteria group bacterium]
MQESSSYLSRRNFIKSTAVTAAAGAAAAAAPSLLGQNRAATVQAAEGSPAAQPAPPAEVKPLPSIQLGSHRVSRLVAGANPLSGYSYQGAHATNCMKEYFTLERRVEYLERCEQLGITAHQFSTYKDCEYIQVAKDRGVKMHYWALHSDIATIADAVKSVAPI